MLPSSGHVTGIIFCCVQLHGTGSLMRSWSAWKIFVLEASWCTAAFHVRGCELNTGCVMKDEVRINEEGQLTHYRSLSRNNFAPLKYSGLPERLLARLFHLMRYQRDCRWSTGNYYRVRVLFLNGILSATATFSVSKKCSFNCLRPNNVNPVSSIFDAWTRPAIFFKPFAPWYAIHIPAITASSTCAVQMLRLLFPCGCCSRVWSAMRYPEWPCASIDAPIIRPGIWRLKSSFVAKNAECGQIPRYAKRWLEPTTISASISPGDFSNVGCEQIGNYRNKHIVFMRGLNKGLYDLYCSVAVRDTEWIPRTGSGR